MPTPNGNATALSSPWGSVDITKAGASDADGLAIAISAGMAAGAIDAVDAFYRRYFDRLYLEARRATRRDEAFCLDVVQEAVLRVIRSVRRVDGEAQLVAWLRLVVRTTAYDLLRAESRRREHESAAAHALPGISMRDAGEDEEREAQLAWLRQRIASLEPGLIEIIEMRYVRQWRLVAIARAMGLSVGAIDGRLRRALHHLRYLAREELHE